MKDRIGMFCSSLCVIHCLAAPIILMLGLTGVVASLLTAEIIHTILIVPVALMIVMTLPSIYKRDRNIRLIIIGLTGLALLVSALIFGEKYEVAFSVAGGILVIMYHTVNLRAQHTRKIVEQHIKIETVL